jgi:hypothetical protein
VSVRADEGLRLGFREKIARQRIGPRAREQGLLVKERAHVGTLMLIVPCMSLPHRPCPKLGRKRQVPLADKTRPFGGF